MSRILGLKSGRKDRVKKKEKKRAKNNQGKKRKSKKRANESTGQLDQLSAFPPGLRCGSYVWLR